MRKYPRPLSTYLGHGPLETLAAAIAEQQRWRELVRNLLPASLVQHCVHVMRNNHALVVMVDSAAGATLLRFQAPGLLSKIQSEVDPSVTEIKVRIGRPLAGPSQSTQPKVMRAAVVQHLEEFQKSCDDPEIREALLRLGQTLKGG